VPELTLPDGVYFSLANVVRARFGGQTRAHLMRNRFFTQHAGIDTTILTFDIQPVYAVERQRLVDRGELVPGMRLLNLYEYYRDTDVVDGTALADALPELPGLVSRDVPHPDGTVYYTAYREPETEEDLVRDYRRADGSVYIRTPAPGRKVPATPWVLADGSGRPVHRWPAKHGWGQHWLQHLLADAPRAFVISDSRDALLPLMPFTDERFHVLHLMHNIHVAGERRWNSALARGYGPLFDRLEDLDGLVTLTRRQREDVAQRFGARDNLFTVSNPVAIPVPPEPRPERDSTRFTIVSRFEPQKRLDHAVRAFALVVAERPQARLGIYGQGALGDSLAALIAQLGIGDQVELCGWDPDARDTLWTSAGFLVTSAFEGYPLATLESLARGCPVVSYDIKYGPREQITDGVDGYLVTEGDRRAMADRVVAMIDDPDSVQRLSTAALAKAGQHDYRVFLRAWAEVLSTAATRRTDRVSLRSVTCTVQRLGYRPVTLPARAARRVGRFLPVRPGAASLDRSRVLVLDAALEVQGRWPKGALKGARVTLDAVSDTTETVTPLPLKVVRTKGTFRLSSRFGLQRVFAGRTAEDRHVTLRLRLVLGNASWETVLRRPETDLPRYEIGYAPTGELQLHQGPAGSA
jgi:poly(glycerol-phosphate) alpha-glucosyltransferase